MNLKKFISGVSALAIAASAFAGLAVTANAAAVDRESQIQTLAGKDVSDSKYGRIVGIDFGDTDSENPFANTVDLASAADNIDDYTYTANDGDFAGTLANASYLSQNHSQATTMGTGHLTVGNGAGSVTIPSGLQVDASKDKVIFTFDYAFGHLSGKYAGFNIYDTDEKLLAGYWNSRYDGKTGDPNTFSLPALYGSVSSSILNWNTYNSFIITLDYATKMMTAKVKKAGDSTYTDFDPVAMPDNAKAVGKFEVKSDYHNNDRRSLFDNLTITNEEGTAVALYPYTLTYKDGDKIVKTESGNRVAGTVVNAVAERFNGDGEYASKYYFVKDGQNTSFTIDTTGNTFNVDVREAEQYNVRYYGTGAYTSDLVNATVIEGDNYTVAFNKFIADSDGKVSAVTSDTWFGGSITPSDDVSVEVPFTAVTDTMYVAEAENAMSGKTDYTSSALSGYHGRRSLEDKRYWVMTVKEDGIYTLNFVGSMYRKDKAYGFNIYNGENVIASYTRETNTVTAGSVVSDSTPNIELHEGDMLYIRSTSDSNGVFDYMTITKTDDIPSAGAVSAATTFDSEPGTPVKSYTFAVTPGTSNGVTQAINSVTVTVKIDDYEDKVQRKTSADFGTISGEATFAVLIGGNVTPTAINVSVD